MAIMSGGHSPPAASPDACLYLSKNKQTEAANKNNENLN